MASSRSGGNGGGPGPSVEQAIVRLQSLIAQRFGENPYKMDEMGQRLILDYAQEITRTILEHASFLAKYKDSKMIEVSDIALVLGNF